MSMSELIRGKNNHCKWCNYCDNIGNCSKIDRNVGWEMANNKEVEDDNCIKTRRNKNEEEEI